MADDAPFRLMNFVSQSQLDESKKNRGERVEDGTAQRDRPLFEILKENKDKKDAEFNERFKHRPPKALDEDETEFLDTVEMKRKEYERKVAEDETQQLQTFQAAVAAQSSVVHELKEIPAVPKVEETKRHGRKNVPAGPLGGLIIKVKPYAKKAKIEDECSDRPSHKLEAAMVDSIKSTDIDRGALGGLASYGDESEDDDN